MMNEPNCSVDKNCPLTLECDLKNVIGQLRAENKEYRKVLDKLARLGNEPEFGNSIGNVMAQQALKLIFN